MRILPILMRELHTKSSSSSSGSALKRVGEAHVKSMPRVDHQHKVVPLLVVAKRDGVSVVDVE
eukprot:1230653-Rhodomonas_salina.1